MFVTIQNQYRLAWLTASVVLCLGRGVSAQSSNSEDFGRCPVDFDGDGVSTTLERLLLRHFAEQGGDAERLLSLGVERNGLIDLSGAARQLSATALESGGGAAMAMGAESACDTRSVNVNNTINVRVEGDTWRYFKGTVHPSPGAGGAPTNAWTQVGFNDTSWLSGPSGIGYGDNDDNTVLSDMQNNYVSVYLRFQFSGSTIPVWQFNSLRIMLDYDDGIRVYINGVLTANESLPADDPLLHTALASAHESSNNGAQIGQLKFFEFDLLAGLAETPFTLSPTGNNVIAVECHNDAITSSDLTCIPEIIGFKRGPFLAIGGPTQTTVAFNTRDNRFGRVNFGTDSGALTQQVTETTATREHTIQLTGLMPGTTYYYQVLAAPTSAPTNFQLFEDDILCFDTPVATFDHEFTFAAFGDCGADTWGDGGGDVNQLQARIANLLNPEVAPSLDPKPEFYLVAGDVIYEDGERENFDARFFRYYGNPLAKYWFYEAVGNHDTRSSASHNDGIFNIRGGSFARAFVLPQGNPAEPIAEREFYYSFDWGPVHVLVLNTTLPPPGGDSGVFTDAQQRAWALNDLASTNRIWKVVCFHHSPYTYAARGNTGGIDDDERLRQNFSTFFEDRDVDLVIAGHEHFYERHHPLRYNSANFQLPLKDAPDSGTMATYTNPQGTLFIVSGGGGRDLSSLPGPQTNDSFRAAGFSDHHVTTIAVEKHRLTIRAIDHTGVQRDTATIVKEIFQRADANDNGVADISDAQFILSFLFNGGPAPTCFDAADTNDSGELDVSEALYLLNFLFNGGPAPPEPFMFCGVDLTPDALTICTPQPNCP
jgi:hypothetical protein